MSRILKVVRLEKYALLDDAENIRLYRQQGDNMAWNEIMHRYHSRLLRYIASITGDNDAEDVLQDTWQIVINAIQSGKYREEQHFSRYIIRVAHVQALMKLHPHHFGELVDELPDEPDDAMNAEELLALADSEALLGKAMKTLGKREERIFILHYFRKMSFKEIGELLHIGHQGSVRGMYSRAVEKIILFIEAHRQRL